MGRWLPVASKTHSRAVQRQIDLTTAVCQEKLLTTHVRHAIAMVDLVSDTLPFDDALDIYVRILRLNSEQARNVGSRALAELGRRSGLPVNNVDLPQPEAEDEVHRREEEAARADGRADAVFSRLRRRLQGRVHAELRYRINLAAAPTEDDLFGAHVENALLFVKALREETSAPEAVDLYLDTMVLPDGLGDVVYNRALRLIADQILQPVPQTRAAGESAGPGSSRTAADRGSAA
jgi:hypothetical protein